MKRLGHTLTMLVAASLGTAGCTDTIEDGSLPPPGVTTGDEDTTFDHDNNQISVWELIDRLGKEGPPAVTSKMHPCTKPRYRTLGNVLRSLGVNVDATAQYSAGQLYSDGDAAMGAPNYANRLRENINVTTSGASREFDLLSAAASEIITNLPGLERCRVGGVGVQLFNGASCVADGITCMIGVPATPQHVELCTLTIQRASTPDIGRRLAVATLLAAAYTCE